MNSSNYEVIDKLNAFFVYCTAGRERLKELFPHLEPFCFANADRTYAEVRFELLQRYPDAITLSTQRDNGAAP